MHADQLKITLELFKMCKFIVAVPSICFKVCLEGCYWEELCLLSVRCVWQCILLANTSLVLKVVLTLDCSCPAFVIFHTAVLCSVHSGCTSLCCLPGSHGVLLFPVCSLLFLHCDPFQVSQQITSLCFFVLLSVPRIVFVISHCWTKCLQIVSLCFKSMFSAKTDFWCSTQTLVLFQLQLHKFILCLNFIHIHDNHLQTILLLPETSMWFFFSINPSRESWAPTVQY